MRATLTVTVGLLFFAACAGSPDAPTAPVIGTGSVAGTIVRTQDRTPIPGAYVAIGGHPTTSDAAGRFSLTGLGGLDSLTVEARGFIPRNSYVRIDTPRSGIEIDLIPNGPPFLLGFYREFARDAASALASFRPLARWTIAPSFYIKTTIETGAAVAPEIVERLKALITNSVRELSAGRLTVAAIETGADARSDADGWVNVIFMSQLFTGELGRATVGGNQGTMWLKFDPANPRIFQNDPSGCYAEANLAASKVIYHTMGYWHVRAEFEAYLADPECDGADLSETVRYHAAIVYSRPPGNADPDDDPSTFTFARANGLGLVASWPVRRR